MKNFETQYKKLNTRQKEAVDNTVIVRNMDTRSQETVPMAELADYVKKIK